MRPIDQPVPAADVNPTAPKSAIGCPACGHAVMRMRRFALDRRAPDGLGLRRYRCLSSECDWKGLLARPDPGQRIGSRLHRRHLIGLGSLACVVAVAAFLALRQTPSEAPTVRIGPHLVQRGTHLEGDRLPDAHGMRRLFPPGILESGSEGYSESPTAALRVRRHCAWGLPGRNPYRGSVQQALQTARLSTAVTQRIAADILAGRRTDRVLIDNSVIRAVGSGREFDPARIALTFGMTLCLDSRVNFQGAHAERGDLFEAMDEDGRIYAVMVPDVCGNVSVLGQRATTVAQIMSAARDAAVPDGLEARPWMRLAPEARPRQLPGDLIHADAEEPDAAAPAGAHVVPLPGTLWLVLPALAMALWAGRRR